MNRKRIAGTEDSRTPGRRRRRPHRDRGAAGFRRGTAAVILASAAAFAASAQPLHAQEDVLLVAYEEYVLEHPGDTERRLEYARALLDRGRQRQAIAQFERVARDPKLEQNALRYLVDLYGWTGQPREQARVYARMLELAPERVDLRRTLADLYFELELHGEGAAHLERILAARPDDLELRRELADRYFANDRTAEGTAQLERILEAHPDDLELRRELANHYFWSDRVLEGTAQLERILEARPNDLGLRRELANHYFWSDRAAQGTAQLERILAARPDDLELRRELALRYAEAGALEEAADQYRGMLEQSGEDPEALAALAEILVARGREADAAPYFERLVAADSTDASARLRLARVLTWTNQPDRALHHVDLILADNPDDPEALLLAGSLRRWEAVGWYRATEHLDRLLGQDPGHSLAQRLLSQLRQTHGPLVAPSVYRATDSNGFTTTRFTLGNSAWASGAWRMGLGLERGTLSDRTISGSTRRSLDGLSTEILHVLPRAGTIGGRIGVHVSPDAWIPVTGRLEYNTRAGRTASASVSAGLSPVLGSPMSIDRRILERRIAATGNVRPFQPLEVWAVTSYSSFTDGNRGVMGGVGGQVNARVAAPSVALFTTYTFEDTETVHDDSRPYWTPRDLSTLSTGIELADSPVPWADLRLRLGLSRQERTSHAYDLRIRLTPVRYHSFDFQFGRYGSDVYSMTSLSLRYSYRMDFR